MNRPEDKPEAADQGSPKVNINNNIVKYGALEMEAAAALLMLRYQYDSNVGCSVLETTPPPPPPPPAAMAPIPIPIPRQEPEGAPEVFIPKAQPARGGMSDSAQPLKKRMLRRSLTPATAESANGEIIEPIIVNPFADMCNKVLLTSCRNMIREFLENPELC